jgi:DNA primase
MPEGVYREMLADRLAARVGMPAATLKKSFVSGDPNRPLAGRPELPGQRQGRISVGRGNLLTQAITLVLHHPAAAAAVTDPEALGKVDRPGVAVLKELLLQAVAATSPSTAMLLERWRDRPEYSRLAELAMADPLVSEPEAAAKELLRKAEELGLNYDEKAELSLLLKSKGRS